MDIKNLVDLKNERLQKFKALKKKMNKTEYNKLFFKYKPDQQRETKKTEKTPNKTVKKKKNK